MVKGYYIDHLEFSKLTPGEAHFYDLNGDEIEKDSVTMVILGTGLLV